MTERPAGAFAGEQVILVDVGNSNTVFGVLREGRLSEVFRLATERSRTADELAALLLPLFQRNGLDPRASAGFVISSVVPPLNAILATLATTIFGCRPLFIEPGIRTGLPIRYDNPTEVGADRIVNSVAARELYGSPVVVVDFGTATTFDVVNQTGDYVGGIIAPGVAISAEALFAQAAKLYRVDLRRPDSLVGRTTSGAMQSGIYYGYLGLVEGILTRLRRELPALRKTVATGGLAELIARDCPLIDEINPNLTLVGLQIVWERNRPRPR